ncbi:hypothetical protein EJ110_NYTH05812 [Nymphaea thermarum]|nr:hypothetical protein EJ110_NYTH05812 [Nymphaea thermarum]
MTTGSRHVACRHCLLPTRVLSSFTTGKPSLQSPHSVIRITFKDETHTAITIPFLKSFQTDFEANQSIFKGDPSNGWIQPLSAILGLIAPTWPRETQQYEYWKKKAATVTTAATATRATAALEAVQGPRVLLCVVLGALGSRLPNLGVLGKAEYLTLDFTHPGRSALPLQRVIWIHIVMGHHGGCLSAIGRPRCARACVAPTGTVNALKLMKIAMLNPTMDVSKAVCEAVLPSVSLKIRFLFVQMEYHRKGKKRAGPSTEAQREPSPAHSDAHTPLDDSSSGHRFAQLGGGAHTPPRQTPPVDQQTILLTTLQTLTSLVQTMVSNQRSNASPSGDTSIPVREKATTVSYQQFMAMQPPIFSGWCSYDMAKHWIEEIERIFVLIRMPEEDKVNYGTYLLKGNALDWWKSTLEICFAGQPSLSWTQFRDSFLDTYYPVHARDQKMQEFLDLQQNQLNLEDYITRYRHLEAYCPHFYTTDGARAGKFVCGLREGLRSKVLSSRPRDLDEAVTMARCIEEDWVRTQKDHQKRAGQHSQGGRTQAVQGPRVLLCVVLGALGSRLPNLGVLGKAEYLTLDFTHPGRSALPLQRVIWIHIVMGHHGGCLSAIGRPRCARAYVAPTGTVNALKLMKIPRPSHVSHSKGFPHTLEGGGPHSSLLSPNPNRSVPYLKDVSHPNKQPRRVPFPRRSITGNLEGLHTGFHLLLQCSGKALKELLSPNEIGGCLSHIFLQLGFISYPVTYLYSSDPYFHRLVLHSYNEGRLISHARPGGVAEDTSVAELPEGSIAAALSLRCSCFFTQLLPLHPTAVPLRLKSQGHDREIAWLELGMVRALLRHQKVEIDAVVIADDEEDWLPPPPKAPSNGENVSNESSILLELSWRSCNWVQMKSQLDGDVCPYDPKISSPPAVAAQRTPFATCIAARRLPSPLNVRCSPPTVAAR